MNALLLVLLHWAFVGDGLRVEAVRMGEDLRDGLDMAGLPCVQIVPLYGWVIVDATGRKVAESQLLDWDKAAVLRRGERCLAQMRA